MPKATAMVSPSGLVEGVLLEALRPSDRARRNGLFKKELRINIAAAGGETKVFKRCCRCGKPRPLTEFYRIKRRGGEYSPFCRSCDRKRTRKEGLALRKQLLWHYSKGRMKCALCPEARIDVLDLDHIKGGGIQHRARFKTPMAFYLHLRRCGFPKGLRVLCRNCNWLAWMRRKKKAYMK